MGLMGWKRPLLQRSKPDVLSDLDEREADEGGDQKAEQEADITIVMPQIELSTIVGRQRAKKSYHKMVFLGADITSLVGIPMLWSLLKWSIKMCKTNHHLSVSLLSISVWKRWEMETLVDRGRGLDGCDHQVGHKTRSNTTLINLSWSDSKEVLFSWRIWLVQVPDLYFGRFYPGTANTATSWMGR